MKKIILALVLGVCSLVARATEPTYVTIEDFSVLKATVIVTEKDVMELKSDLQEANDSISALRCLASQQAVVIDSLSTRIGVMVAGQDTVNQMVAKRLNLSENGLEQTNNSLSSRTFWLYIVIGIIALLVFGTVVVILKRINRGRTSINEVRAAQDALQKAQAKMQEESVGLDNKLLTLMERQMESSKKTSASSAEQDHSLALKVADEIVRIETNLSRMDPNVKGYKQLAKAVQRIKDNFQANGYEIVDMLGKPYNAGMKAAATFVTDESLAPGQQIISKIIKPQINYNQQMIQAAQIEVSQPE